MKKKLWILFAAALVFCAGCRSGTTVTQETTTQASQEETKETAEETQAETTLPGQVEIAVWLGNDLSSLDPAQAIYNTEKTILRHEYETLLVRNEEGEAQPGQAESWEVSDDGLMVTFHLRDGLKWSDGSSLTADDFIYAWNRLADPTEPSPYAEDLLGGVEGFEKLQGGDASSLSLAAPDEQTLVVTLSAPDFSFPEKCTAPAMSPLKQDAVEDGGSRWFVSSEYMVSNGPMKFLEYTANGQITLVKNEYYWNADRVSLTSITMLQNGSEEENLERYEAGELDLVLCGVDWTSGQDEATSSTAAFADQFTAPLAASSYVLINTEIEPFQDERVRQALSLSLDRDYIADVVMEGTVKPAWTLIGWGYADAEEGSSFVETSMEDYAAFDTADAGADAAKDRLSLAQSLLEEAGYPNGKGIPEIEYLVNDSGYNLALAQYLRTAWGSLGLSVKINKVTWAYFTPYRHDGDFTAARGTWMADLNDPGGLLSQFSSDAENNDGHYSNDQVDELLTEASAASSRADYYSALHQAEQLILEDAAAIPIAFYQEGWLQDTKLCGVRHLSDGTWNFAYSYYADPAD